MASLRAYLPPAGSTVWRNERRLTRTSSSDGEVSLSRTRIKHIVIREVWKRNVPSPHALYKIDVMTQSNHWFILRRYREFYSLHQNLVKHYGIPSDMLPSKKIASKMSLNHLEKRRNSLEHYLQRLINSHHDIAESVELFQFLDVHSHDVLCVTRHLAKVLEKEGQNVLANGGLFTFSPTQMYCITRQLQLPHCVVEPSGSSGNDEEIVDLGFLYCFVQELKSLCVSGLTSRTSPCQELISNQAFDISLFKALEKLQIDKCHISVIDGLFRIQKQLTHITVRKSLKTMKEFLVDCATQKRAVKQAKNSVEPWRNQSTTKLTENRVVVRPWILLTHVNMSHNKITSLDHSLKLLPALEQLDLSYNEFAHLDFKQLTSSTLTFLNISHNNIHYISATTKDLRNLKSLLLSHNKLQTLDGLDCLRGLVELDIRHNEIKNTEELVKISSLLHMRILALTGNPFVACKSHRIRVFSQLRSRELILDGIKITESEKTKVQQQQEYRVKDLAVQTSVACTSVACTSLASTSGTYSSPARQPNSSDTNRKTIEVYRDDDQDSGFGGTYGGSIDDGGLVFDWSCYGEPVLMIASSDSYESGLIQGSPMSCRDCTSTRESTDTVPRQRNDSDRNCPQGNLSSIYRQTLKEGGMDKGKAPMRVRSLQQNASKFPENNESQWQRNVTLCELAKMHLDLQLRSNVQAKDASGKVARAQNKTKKYSDNYIIKKSSPLMTGGLTMETCPVKHHNRTHSSERLSSLNTNKIDGGSSPVVSNPSNISSSLPSTIGNTSRETWRIIQEPCTVASECSSDINKTNLSDVSSTGESHIANISNERTNIFPQIGEIAAPTSHDTDLEHSSVSEEHVAYTFCDILSTSYNEQSCPVTINKNEKELSRSKINLSASYPRNGAKHFPVSPDSCLLTSDTQRISSSLDENSFCGIVDGDKEFSQKST